MSIRFEAPFRAGLMRVRPRLGGRERDLFDLVCAAGQLGYRLTDTDINLRHASGARDPRKRLAAEFPFFRPGRNGTTDAGAWEHAGDRLACLLEEELTVADGNEERRALRVLLAYATIALAPDCVVPRDAVSRAAWNSMVRLFARLFPSKVKPLGRLDCLARLLAKLKRETVTGLRIGRVASGRRPGPEGRRLAVEPELIAAAGKALGKDFSPGYMARYLFYSRAGDHIWPHPDDPQWAVTLLACVVHDLAPRQSTGSAFVAYGRNGSMKRYNLAPGEALAVEPGAIHAREPVRAGEQVALLSIGLCRPARAGD